MIDPAQAQIPDWYATARGRRAARLLAARLAPLLKGSATSRLLAVGVTVPVLVRIHDQRHERRALVTGLPATRWPTLVRQAAPASPTTRGCRSPRRCSTMRC